MRAAIVGAGRIALEHLAALKTVGPLEVFVCDRSAAAAEHLAERFELAAWYVDFEEMLHRARPDVVHVTTPAETHVPLARRALESGAHVLVEKPIALTYTDWLELRDLAVVKDRWLLEDHAYQFNRPVQRVLGLIEEGVLGDVVHVDLMYALDIHASGSILADTDAPHPSHALPGGAIFDFLTHLAYLSWLFVGDHRAVHTSWRRRSPRSLSVHDEMSALVEAERGNASLGFTANAQPNGFFVRVYGTKMLAHMNLFENTLRLDRTWRRANALTPLRNGLRGSWSDATGAVRSFKSKLSGGSGASEGVRELVRRTHTALCTSGSPPIGLDQIDGTNRLVHDLLSGLDAA